MLDSTVVPSIDAAVTGDSGDAEASIVREDGDSDGLCDDTEQRAGTDPDNPDTDADGYPDVIERYYGFAPVDASSPANDQLAFLDERVGASVELLAQVWIEDGAGLAHTGVFESEEAIGAADLDAADFHAEVTAISAEPPDHVFDIDPAAARFGAVNGNARLTFSVGFVYTDQSESGCIRGLPFSFSVKRAGSDRPVGRRQYMLLVVPPGSAPRTGPWCPTGTCI